MLYGHRVENSSDSQQPPHAAPRRRLAEDPLEVVERLLADQASELDNDERWQTYGEIDDHLAQQRAQLSLASRLAKAVGRQVIAKPLDQPAMEIEIVETNDEWCEAVRGGRKLLLSLQAIAQWSNLPATAGDISKRSTAALVRGYTGKHVTLYLKEQTLHGKLTAAMQDHLDLQTDQGNTTIPYTYIRWIE